MSDYGFLVPIVFLLSFAGFFCVRLRYRHLDRLAAQETIRGALERGQPLTPELVTQLVGKEAANGDLRRGVISIAVAIAFVAFGFGVGGDDEFGPMTAIAAFPLFIGLAYLGLHRFAGTRDSAPV